MSVEFSELSRVFRQLPDADARRYVEPLNKALLEFEVNTRLREAAFLGQIGEESGELRWWREFASGSEYENRRDLGNVKPGDGRRYHGRCPIMLTGRANYRLYGQLLGVDLEANPELAADVGFGFRIAACYWKRHGLNELADARRYVAITRRVNGGLNGLASRQLYYALALKYLDGSMPQNADRNDTLDLKIVFNGQIVSSDGFNKEGVAWSPLRKIAEALGISVVDVDNDSAQVVLATKKASIPLLIHGKTGFSPVRSVAEIGGWIVAWDAANRSVLVGSGT